MTRNVLKTTLENASFRIVFQIACRCMTFVLNAWVLRLVGPDILGVMNIRLLLLESTLIFLCQEPCLKACQTNTKFIHWPQVINQIWLTVPACFTLAFPLLYVWTNVLSSVEAPYVDQYNFSCLMMVISCVIFQMCNCPTLIAMNYGFVKFLVFTDAMGVFFRTVLFVVLIYNNTTNAIWAFGIAQIFYSIFQCTFLYGFFWRYIRRINELRKKDTPITGYVNETLFSHMDDFHFESIRDFFPLVMKNQESTFDKSLSLLTVSFAKQCVVKQILTEGERYVMTLSPVLTFHQQATYDIVNNLGSLAARFLLRPIEESGYYYFTQMIHREKRLLEQEQSTVANAAEVLSQLLHIVTSIGLIGLVFGQSYSHTLLYLYGGSVLVSSGLPTILLRCHCFAILLLAINGVAEGYVFATMNSVQLDRYNYIMVIFSITFLIFSYAFTYVLGPVGFILANCTNMTARIIHSVYFIQNQFKNIPCSPLRGILPSFKFLMALVVSGIVTRWSEVSFFI